MALPIFMLGRVLDGLFYPINPRYEDDEMVFDSHMDVRGAQADFVSALMGNTWIIVTPQAERIVFAIRGDIRAFFNGSRTTQATTYPSSGVHELRLIREDHELVLHYYVSATGAPPTLIQFGR
ncbi:hypothetical protein HN358_05265 [Candidatus Uhrbacteria bacterium]|jgi:hypothetical protein|nr:hypothetical protein [Candidatus Uhrbacteria bacterium]MBT7716829.1 hypothetical protein [Candidatus Uhrbacteria bacterium]